MRSRFAPHASQRCAPGRGWKPLLIADASLRPPQRSAPVVAAAAPTVEKLGADMWNTTYYPKGVDHVPTEKTWYLIDAKGQRLGRMAVLIAQYLRGANKATYTPSQDMGSYVVVINAEQVAVTGRKAEQKMYVRHTTGRPGGHVVESFQALQKRIPTRIVEEAGACLCCAAAGCRRSPYPV